MERVKKSATNLVYNIVLQVVKLLIIFTTRTVFIYTIGIEYLGLDGIFANMLTLLSLPEMGIGSAIIFSMYKPIAEENKEKIKSILKFYRNVYLCIAFIILGLGLASIPLLPFIVNMPEAININMYVVYILFLSNTIVGYFSAYKRSIIAANQRNFIESIVKLICTILLNAAQILVLIISKNYILYLILVIAATIIENIIITIIANKLYPFIKEKSNKIDKETRKEVIKNSSATFISKISSTVVMGTDNIVISVFLGLSIVGMYSNYIFIIRAIATFIGYFIISFSASIGNLIATSDNKKIYDVYKKLHFVFMFINMFVSVCLITLLTPFITMWAGYSNVLPFLLVVILVFNNFVSMSRDFVRVFKQASGLFWNDRFSPLIEAILNIVISISLVYFLGIIGIALGTVLSSLSAGFISEPYVVYKHCFKEKLFKFYLNFFISWIVVMVISALNIFLIYYLPSNVGFLILKFMICIFTTFIILFFWSFRNENFKYYSSIVKGFFIKKSKRNFNISYEKPSKKTKK